MTVASLGFKIDSSPASAAAVDLEKLTAAAVKTEKSVESLEQSARGLGTALGAAGKGADDLKKPVDSIGRSFGAQDEHVKAFRMELERLTMKYQPLAQATQRYEASVGEINRAHQLGVINAKQMQQALEAERLAFERLKTSAASAGAAVQAANQNNVTGAQRAAGINAGYQFQDIAVTAAMGMSPIMIGLQQGTQLASVMASMERPVMGLAAAFTSIISPVTLVTVGLTAGVAALVQYFSASEDGSAKMEADLEQQSELIQTVAARWGDAVPALKAYADELQRAREEQEKQEASSSAAEMKIKGLRGEMDGLVAAMGRLDTDFSLSNAINSADTEKVSIFRQNMLGVKDAIEAGKDPTLALNSALESLSTIMGDTSNPVVKEFYDLLSGAADKMREVADEARSFTSLPRLSPIWSEGGRVLNEEMFIPRVPGVPSRRPSDLAGDPDVVSDRVLNSDGLLVTPGVPTRKPNFFELEKENEKVDEVTRAYRRAQEAKADFWLDLSFSERQSGRSAMDRQIANTLNRYGFNEDLNSPEANALREQLREGEARDIFKGFFSGAYSEAWSNGGKIGKAIATAALNAAQEASQKAFEALFDTAASWLASLFTGKAGASAAGPDIVSKAIGAAANDNAALSAPVTSVARAALPATTEIGAYIREAAIKRGIDPDIALRVAKSEGGIDSWNLQSNYVKNGVREPSFGPFQLYKGGGLGNAMIKQTGLDPALAINGPAGVDFALDNAKKSGWGQWYGAAKAGIGDWEGIDRSAKAVKDLGNAATDTAKMTAGLGQTLASIPQALMANGGGSGALASLTKYGMGLFGGSSQFASAWLKGGIGLYANGTDYSRGGLSIVGDNGPELLNLPQGSGVMSNHKLMSMMAANQNRSGDGIAGIRLFVDQDGNWQAKVESIARNTAKTEDRQSMGAYKQNQQRMGYGEDQRRFNSRKG